MALATFPCWNHWGCFLQCKYQCMWDCIAVAGCNTTVAGFGGVRRRRVSRRCFHCVTCKIPMCDDMGIIGGLLRLSHKAECISESDWSSKLQRCMRGANNTSIISSKNHDYFCCLEISWHEKKASSPPQSATASDLHSWILYWISFAPRWHMAQEREMRPDVVTASSIVAWPWLKCWQNVT